MFKDDGLAFPLSPKNFNLKTGFFQTGFTPTKENFFPKKPK